MQNEWEAEAKNRGYLGEKEMWEDLYTKKGNSLNQLVKMFDRSINNIRSRIDSFQIPKRSRGGANNTKYELSPELINDIVTMGVRQAALKHGIKPQTLYQRVYYKSGLTIKGLRESMSKVPEHSPPNLSSGELDHSPHAPEPSEPPKT
jgi:hypothetical protein